MPIPAAVATLGRLLVFKMGSNKAKEIIENEDDQENEIEQKPTRIDNVEKIDPEPTTVAQSKQRFNPYEEYLDRITTLTSNIITNLNTLEENLHSLQTSETSKVKAKILSPTKAAKKQSFISKFIPKITAKGVLGGLLDLVLGTITAAFVGIGMFGDKFLDVVKNALGATFTSVTKPPPINEPPTDGTEGLRDLQRQLNQWRERSSGANLSTREAIAARESGGVERLGYDPYQVPNLAGTSSAFGKYQFVRGTWIDTYRKAYPDSTESDNQIWEKRTDPVLQEQLVDVLTEDNVRILRNAGLPATEGTIYLAHFLGAPAAVKVLKADSLTAVEDLVSAEAVAANRSVLEGKTVGEVLTWAGVDKPVQIQQTKPSTGTKLTEMGEADEERDTVIITVPGPTTAGGSTVVLPPSPQDGVSVDTSGPTNLLRRLNAVD